MVAAADNNIGGGSCKPRSLVVVRWGRFCYGHHDWDVTQAQHDIQQQALDDDPRSCLSSTCTDPTGYVTLPAEQPGARSCRLRRFGASRRPAIEEGRAG
jgi:hypothetical protein